MAMEEFWDLISCLGDPDRLVCIQSMAYSNSWSFLLCSCSLWFLPVRLGDEPSGEAKIPEFLLRVVV